MSRTVRPHSTTVVAALMALLTLLALAPTASVGATEPDAPTIVVLSGRPELVSGGDALVELVLPAGAGDGWSADVDGQDVTAAFAERADGRITGLVDGLAIGPNTLTVRLADGRAASVVLDNHPRSGPVFSGPQVPWLCPEDTEEGTCARVTTFEFFYVAEGDMVEEETCDAMSSTVTNRTPDEVDEAYFDAVPPCFKPYDPANPPSDVAIVTTTEDVEVPYIVRLETGIMDRDEYQVAVLFDPSQPWDPFDPQAAWNRRLVVKHGSSCGADFATEPAPPVLDEDRALSKGFAVMSTALSDSGHSCHVGLQAESLIMAKEHVIETYGEVRWTMGRGGSGGALAQQWVANAYPGMYDGLLLGQSFPDGWSTVMEIEDCHLMDRYWLDPTQWAPGVAWTEPQMAAVSGTAVIGPCQVWDTAYGYPDLFNPSKGRSCDFPSSQRYDAVERPDGIRCTLQDYSVGIFGRRAADGFAHRPYDNVGVQYGLRALQDGLITPAQFVDLNANVGGRDIDGVWRPGRVEATPEALERAYRSGSVNTGHNMEGVAIIDSRGTNSFEIHHQVRSLVMRARLDAANGHHDNHVQWWGPVATNGDPKFSSAAFDLMDEWLAAVEADASDAPLADKVVANKPEGAVDRCTNGQGEDAPVHHCDLVEDATPRMVAGLPLTDDVLKCQLRPIDPDEYGPLMLPSDLAALQEIFPDGVCDTTAPGVGQQPTVPWLDYTDGPGGLPLAPVR